ncbi:methyltransferase domain-containing protein [Candidatus Saccharibacteria bacterium]|nr:methyltransferase domain-containing protein [Candidatus Saccharibacteria bacterium]
MSKENEETLKIYEYFGNAYLNNAHKRRAEKVREVKEKRTKAILSGLAVLGEDARVLEIGSADGEVALLTKELGFKAYASDVSSQFLAAIAKTGLPYYKFNVLKDDLDGRKFDGIIAFRVFVHFTPEDFAEALVKIYKLLRPGGRFVSDILNIEDKGGKTCEWCDFGNGYEIGADRFFYYYDEKQVKDIIKNAGFRLEDFYLSGGDSGYKWFNFVLAKPSGIRPEVEECIKKKILPKYEKLSGHTITHINQVISRSLAIAEDLPEVDRDMVYVIAAYHDLGRLVDDETHNIESGKMVRKDKELKKLFDEKQIEVIAEAVEDHRASLKGDPRSIYGRIVSSADRYMDLDDMLARSYDYTRHLHPEMSDDEVIEEARIHLREKFKPDGYGAKKVYYPSIDDKECFETIERITRDPLAYRKIVKEFNKKRGK